MRVVAESLTIQHEGELFKRTFNVSDQHDPHWWIWEDHEWELLPYPGRQDLPSKETLEEEFQQSSESHKSITNNGS